MCGAVKEPAGAFLESKRESECESGLLGRVRKCQHV